ncbi:MAG: hypothetical protein AAF420_10995 [Pseudomonadota bacterium]
MHTLNIEFDDRVIQVQVPESLVVDARDFFQKLDSDMDQGWQMSRWWVPNPDALQRCQIVADKLLHAVQSKNSQYGSLLCAYILHQLPDTRRILINTQGEIQGNEFRPE